MALTGLTWSFEWYRNGAYMLLGADRKATTAQQSKTKGDTSANNYDASEVVYDDVVAQYDGYNDVTVTPTTLSVKLSGFGNPRAADKYFFDADGAITSVELYDDAPRQRKIGGWIYAIHVGNFGGYLTRILWFLAAMLGASLPITGYYLSIKRRFINRK
jgi:uncharacterized iron-regulated membrane protein